MTSLKTSTFKDGDISLDVTIKDNTGWLSTKQIATLFGVDRSTITRHISTTYNRNILSRENTCALLCISGQDEMQKVKKERAIPHYNLEIIMELARRLNSEKGTIFSKFVEKALKNPLDLENSESIVYNNGALSIDVKLSPDRKTVWLTQIQIAQLFDTTQPNVSMHISNILNDLELDNSVYKDFLYTATDGKKYMVRNYNLDMILAVGYRIKSNRAIQFRKWASSILSSYIVDGYVIDKSKIINMQDSVIRLSHDIESIKFEICKLKDEKEQQVFDRGQYFDAYSYMIDLIKRAKNSITIFDPFFDEEAIKYLKIDKKNVVKRICLSRTDLISKETVETFKKQYGPVVIRENKNIHDRFIIVDNTKCFAIGTSLNHMGNKLFVVNQIKNKGIIDLLLSKFKKSKIVY